MSLSRGAVQVRETAPAIAPATKNPIDGYWVSRLSFEGITADPALRGEFSGPGGAAAVVAVVVKGRAVFGLEGEGIRAGGVSDVE